jgi:hypothetical protein
MKSLFPVCFGAVFAAFTASAALASSSVTTEFGRPLLVEKEVSVAACSDVAFSAGQDAQSWHDALAGKRAHDRLVQASWTNALASKRLQDRAVVLANAGAAPAADCALTN